MPSAVACARSRRSKGSRCNNGNANSIRRCRPSTGSSSYPADRLRCEVYVPISCQLRTSPPSPSAGGEGTGGLYSMWKVSLAPDTPPHVKCNAHRVLWTASSGLWSMSDAGRILHRAQCFLSRASRIMSSASCAPLFVRRRMSVGECTTARALRISFFRACLTRHESRRLANDARGVHPAQRPALPLFNTGSKLAPISSI
jgi:hypothetical protein